LTTFYRHDPSILPPRE